ncbi:exonuclease domain-containing protein [Acetobacterium wieringae]|uniref:DNA polymerase III PolC-type n=1 Tax=Acetobacterium wieringae TaxID=52694 RepID=A0A1F2PEP4_9FIRM|nr:exonuclease domain-containing protein [Acetobacterium wieringae]OFV69141.1 DNA polymerase III PolC-type [Acetobacterium wieringae]
MTKSKKNSIIDFPNEFVVVDIETTGLSPVYDSIIEVSALKVKNNQIVDSFTSLAKPSGGFMPLFPSEDRDYLYDNDGRPFYYVSEFITNLTGITNEMLNNAPDLKSVLNDFFPFVADSIIVGHNVSFDINFLKANISELLNENFDCNYVDTMRIARKLFKDKKHHRLIDIVDYLEIQVDESKTHRSLYDCEITLNCYDSMKNLALESYETINAFTDLFSKINYLNYDPRSLVSESESIDETNPLFNKECIFTGTLDKLVRKDAQQMVVNLGGSCGKSVTQKTNYLILGNNDYCKSIKDGKSNKHKKAEELKIKGFDIEIMTEDVFYNLIGLEI